MKRRGFNFQEIDQASETDFLFSDQSVTLTKPLVAKLSHAYQEAKFARYRRTKVNHCATSGKRFENAGLVCECCTVCNLLPA